MYTLIEIDLYGVKQVMPCWLDYNESKGRDKRKLFCFQIVNCHIEIGQWRFKSALYASNLMIIFSFH